jgi:beta-galactosidase
LLGEHQSGYIGFRYDITHVARYGTANTLAVRVDARMSEGWWYEGGGIYRHVWLTVVDPVHIAPWGVYVTSAVQGIDPTGRTQASAGSNPSAVLTVSTTLANDSGTEQSVLLVSRAYGPGGVPAGVSKTQVSIAANGSAVTAVRIPIAQAHLWSLETPNMYRLHTIIVENGSPVDTVDTPFGVRTEYFDADRGFFLNGRHVEIQGVCNHQDFAGVGIALPDTLFKYRIARMKWIGCNAFRTSHNPVAPELLDECDRQGILVMDENRHLGDTYSPKSSSGTTYSDLSDLKSMILRDRNHPSVIMWSLCNEEFALQATDEGARIFSGMMRVVRALDKTRPISCAMNGGQGYGISNVEDLVGFNYNPWSYDPYHASHPDRPMFGSETASAVSDRGIYSRDAARGYVDAYDTTPAGSWATTAEAAWQPIDARPYMAGGFVWTGFDYRGEPTPYGWPCINSHFGILDMCGFAKDSAYYYRAWWGDKPVVHILPHWNWPGLVGTPIDVWCYANSEQVELFLNGRSLGVKTMPRAGHVDWMVPYAPGTLVAKGYTNGKLTAVDRVETTGAPAAIRLSTDFSNLSANGEDTAPVTVSIVDSDGRIVPTAGNLVAFQVSGAGHINGVGNGDPSSHDPDRASQRHAFNGLCMVLVQSGDKSGTIRLTANSPGLRPGVLTLSVR